MNRTRKIIECLTLFLSGAVFCVMPAHAQETMELRWSFARTSNVPVASQPTKELLRAMPGSYVADSVLIIGWSSPDGPEARNAALSSKRAKAVADSITGRLGQSVKVIVEGGGEWWTGVTEYVAASEDPAVASRRSALLAVIDREHDLDRREWILRDRYPEAWAVVKEKTYAEARAAVVTLWYHTVEKDAGAARAAAPEEGTPEYRNEFTAPASVILIAQKYTASAIASDDTLLMKGRKVAEAMAADAAMVDAPAADTVRDIAVAEEKVASFSSGFLSSGQPYCDRLWRTAFRTNLLVPALNVGFEAALGQNRRFVLGTEFWFPWLRPFIKDAGTCLEGLGWSVDGTFYFKRSADPKRWATGPYLGLSGAAGYYDVCFNARGRQGEGLAATLYFGWSWPVNRGRWRLSLDIGGGYMVTKYREYYVWEDGLSYRPSDWEGVLRWWGPTRASFALHIPVWYTKR